MTETHDPVTQEMLLREQRVCARCAYPVRNPFTDRCPRCFSALPVATPHCSSCLSQGNCTFAHGRTKDAE